MDDASEVGQPCVLHTGAMYVLEHSYYSYYLPRKLNSVCTTEGSASVLMSPNESSSCTCTKGAVRRSHEASKQAAREQAAGVAVRRSRQGG